MKFLYPQFLWALLAILIPILIHLFNFRKFKKVYFSNLSMLKQVDLETNKRSKLKHLLVLITRVLAITLLVLAFAQPYFPKNNQNLIAGKKAISVYIDNSFSMGANTDDGNLLYLAKQKAINIANEFKPSDEFQLLTNDFEGKHQRFVSRNEFIELVNATKLTSISRLLSSVQSKQLDLINNSTSKVKNIFLLSDFQKSTTNIEALTNDSLITTNAIQLQSNSPYNIYIDSVWFDGPIRQLNKDEVLKVKLVNTSNESAQVRLELQLNEKVKSFSNVLVESNSFAEATLSFKNRSEGSKNCKITISEYPNPDITYDDDYYFGYLLNKNSSVLSINQTTIYNDTTKGNINNLFSNDKYFKLNNTSAGNVNYSEINKYNLIILNSINDISSGLQNELLKYVTAGGDLIIFPGKNINTKNYNELLLSLNIGRLGKIDTNNSKVNYLNIDHNLFNNIFEKSPKNIDLPNVLSYYKLNRLSKSKSETLMRLQNGNDFLSIFNYQSGNVYLFTVPLDSKYSNLGNHSIFVATLNRIAESSGFQKQISYSIDNDIIAIKDENYKLENLHVVGATNKSDFIPEAQRQRGNIALYMDNQIFESGNYSIVNDKTTINTFGFNYNRKESNLSCFGSGELKNILKNKNISLVSINNKAEIISKSINYASSKLWKWFIVIALAFLAIEILIIRLLK